MFQGLPNSSGYKSVASVLNNGRADRSFPIHPSNCSETSMTNSDPGTCFLT